MFAGDRKTCLRTVVKINILLPRLVGMARLASFGRGIQLVEDLTAIAVVIAVTAGTSFLQAFKIEILNSLALIARLVTIHAGSVRMGSVKGKACGVVLEKTLLPILLVMAA